MPGMTQGDTDVRIHSHCTALTLANDDRCYSLDDKLYVMN